MSRGPVRSRPGGPRRYHAAVRTLISCSIATALIAGALVTGCQGCSDPRERPAGGDTVEFQRLDTVHLDPGGSRLRTTSLDLPAPRLRSLELLDPGQEPRQALRYDAGAGGVLTVTLRVKSREHIDNEWSPWGPLPEIRYGLALERGSGAEPLAVRGIPVQIGAGGANGADDPEVRAYVTEAAEQLALRYREQLEGRRATGSIDARGLIQELAPVAETTPAPGAHTQAEMLQILAESIVPVPEQAVGPGARWRATMLMRRGAGMVNQVGTYELRAIEQGDAGPAWRIHASLAQDGEHQVVSAPGLPQGMTAELLALVWRAEGELVVSPASLTPRSGTLAVEYRVHSRLDDGRSRVDSYLESQGEVDLATEPR